MNVACKLEQLSEPDLHMQSLLAFLTASCLTGFAFTAPGSSGTNPTGLKFDHFVDFIYPVNETTSFAVSINGDLRWNDEVMVPSSYGPGNRSVESMTLAELNDRISKQNDAERLGNLTALFQRMKEYQEPGGPKAPVKRAQDLPSTPNICPTLTTTSMSTSAPGSPSCLSLFDPYQAGLFAIPMGFSLAWAAGIVVLQTDTLLDTHRHPRLKVGGTAAFSVLMTYYFLMSMISLFEPLVVKWAHRNIGNTVTSGWLAMYIWNNSTLRLRQLLDAVNPGLRTHATMPPCRTGDVEMALRGVTENFGPQPVPETGIGDTSRASLRQVAPNTLLSSLQREQGQARDHGQTSEGEIGNGGATERPVLVVVMPDGTYWNAEQDPSDPTLN